MSSTPHSKIKDEQKPVESHEKQEIPQAFRGRVTGKIKKNTLDAIEEECFQGETREHGMVASFLQDKELSLDKNSLLRITNEGHLCSVFASLP